MKLRLFGMIAASILSSHTSIAIADNEPLSLEPIHKASSAIRAGEFVSMDERKKCHEIGIIRMRDIDFSK